jgi:hypothetical protein
VNEAYPDDFHLAELSPDADSLGPVLTERLKHVSRWSEENKLGIAPVKSTVNLFSPHIRQANYHPEVKIGDVSVSALNCLESTSPTASLLLTTLTPFSTPSSHLNFSSISGQEFGDKKMLKITYNAYMKSTMTPVWFPSMNPGSTAIQRLQCNQNAAMHTITGAHRNSHEGHLLAETQLLPVREHLGLVCK